MRIRIQRTEKRGKVDAERTVDERPCENGDYVGKREGHLCDIEGVRGSNVYLDGPSDDNDAIRVNDGQGDVS
jgi:hypothetical protein